MQAVKAAIDKHATPPANSNNSTQAKTFRQAVIDAIKQTNYDGATGNQSFDANGDTVNKTVTIYTLGRVGVADGWKFLMAVTPSSTS